MAYEQSYTKLKEAKKQYNLKEEYLNSNQEYATDFVEVMPKDFYRELFPKGSFIADEGEYKGLPNGFFHYTTTEKDYKIALQRALDRAQYEYKEGLKSLEGFGIDENLPEEMRLKIIDEVNKNWNAGEYKKRGKAISNGAFYPQRVHDNLQELDFAMNNPKAIMAPIGYFGNSSKSKYAHSLFAIVIDLDDVDINKMCNLLKQFHIQHIPYPTFLVNSGNGFHLYYCLNEPIPCYTYVQKQITNLKNALCINIWNDTTSSKKKRDAQPFSQGYRIVGSLSKLGKGYPVRAHRHAIFSRKYTLQELVDCVRTITLKDNNFEFPNLEKYQTTMTLAEAKVKYPEWYERKIEGKGSIYNRKPFTQHRGIYDSWKVRMYDAEVGHRYNCIKILYACAIKCGIPREEVDQDAYNFIEIYDKRSKNDTNRFTEQDVKDASQCYKDEYRNMSLDSIIKLSAIHIDKNKRNRRYNVEGETQQQTHLRIRANPIRDALYPDKSWINKEGRPKGSQNKVHQKEQQIRAYLLENPDANNSQISRDLKIDRKTVIKWVKVIKNQSTDGTSI